MIVEYVAPKLTKYGKIANIIQAGSVVALQSGDVTGDGTADQAFDTNGDGKADRIVGGANGGVTPVTFLGNAAPNSGSFDFYDSDGDGAADFVIGPFTQPTQSLGRITAINSYYISLSNGRIYTLSVVNAPISVETSYQGGWDEPARD